MKFMAQKLFSLSQITNSYPIFTFFYIFFGKIGFHDYQHLTKNPLLMQGPLPSLISFLAPSWSGPLAKHPNRVTKGSSALKRSPLLHADFYAT
jgi:hypothetical protein